jgi:hypothetical protein
MEVPFDAHRPHTGWVASDEAAELDRSCTVRQAAEILGCKAQLVRNLLDDHSLVGGYEYRGGRRIRWVSRQSAIELRAARGRPLGRPSRVGTATADERAAEHLAKVTDRIAALEALLGVSSGSGASATRQTDANEDTVNLRFANLALLAANEAYAEAITRLRLAQRLQIRAQERSGQAIDALNLALSQFREVIAQHHIPGTLNGD